MLGVYFIHLFLKRRPHDTPWFFLDRVGESFRFSFEFANRIQHQRQLITLGLHRLPFQFLCFLQCLLEPLSVAENIEDIVPSDSIQQVAAHHLLQAGALLQGAIEVVDAGTPVVENLPASTLAAGHRAPATALHPATQ